VDVIARQEALANLFQKQENQQQETMRQQTGKLENYYSLIASGRSPQEALSYLTGVVGVNQARADIGAGTGVSLGPVPGITGSSTPNLLGFGAQTATQLQSQITLLQQTVQQLQIVNQKLTPRPGSH
jgi:hypothetical protein